MMNCKWCGTELREGFSHLVDKGYMYCSLECVQNDYESRDKVIEIIHPESRKLTVFEAMNLLKEGHKVRKVGWKRKSDYVFLDEDGYIRWCDGTLYEANLKIGMDWELVE